MTAKSKPRRRFTHELDVVGLRFRLKRDVRRALAGTIRSQGGIRGIRFEREPGNEYDANAIAVYLPTRVAGGMQIGYLSRPVAEQLAPRLDDGSLRIVGGTLTELYEADDWNSGNLLVDFSKSA